MKKILRSLKLDQACIKYLQQHSTPHGEPMKSHTSTLDLLHEHAAPVQSEDLMAEAGRKMFLHDFAQILDNELGSRKGEDIEHVHDDTPIGYQVVYRVSEQTLAALEEINRLKQSESDVAWSTNER